MNVIQPSVPKILLLMSTSLHWFTSSTLIIEDRLRRNLLTRVSKNEFIQFCVSTLLADSTDADGDSVLSQHEFATFLASLSCHFLLSPENNKDDCLSNLSPKPFEAVPITFQLYFAVYACKHIDDNDEDKYDCMENMVEENFSGEKFGFFLDRPGYETEKDIVLLCADIYEGALGEGYIFAPTPRPTSSPILSPPRSLTLSPTASLRNSVPDIEIKSENRGGYMLAIGVLTLSVLMICILLCIRHGCVRRRRQRRQQEEQDFYSEEIFDEIEHSYSERKISAPPSSSLTGLSRSTRKLWENEAMGAQLKAKLAWRRQSREDEEHLFQGPRSDEGSCTSL